MKSKVKDNEERTMEPRENANSDILAKLNDGSIGAVDDVKLKGCRRKKDHQHHVHHSEHRHSFIHFIHRTLRHAYSNGTQNIPRMRHTVCRSHGLSVEDIQAGN